MYQKCLCLIMALLLTTSSAMAGSILPAAPVAAQPQEAISFASAVGATPAATSTNADGSISERYEDVTAAQYDTFGIQLGEEGYVLTDHSQTDGIMYITVQNAQVSLQLVYEPAAARLTVIYPAGVTPRRPLPTMFEGYEIVELGQPVDIPGYGTFTFDELRLNADSDITYFAGLGIYGKMSFLKADAYLTGTFLNKGVDAISFNRIAGFDMYYITDDNTYAYDDLFIGMQDDGNAVYCGSKMQSSGISFDIDPSWPFSDTTPPKIKSLESGAFAAVFADVPEAAMTATDGILAVTITVPAAEKAYVVYIRY